MILVAAVVGLLLAAPLATMTVVRPQLAFGVTEIDASAPIRGFYERPHSEHWISAAFFCSELDLFDYFDADGVLEREPLEQPAADGELRAFGHDALCDCMETYNDALLLCDLWPGTAPWKVGEPTIS